MPRFNLDWLPQTIADYCKSLTETCQVSPDLLGVTALGVLSVATQKSKIILRDGWEEYCTLYVANIQYAGEKKSLALGKLSSPLTDWQDQKNTSLKSEISSSKQKYRLLKKRCEQAEKDALAGKISDEEAVQIACQLDDFQPVRPVQLFSDDCTAERLVQLLAENKEQFAVLSAEGGILSIISGRRYSQTSDANVDVYLKSFFGEPVQVDRVNRASDTLRHPTLSMVLNVQPTAIKKLVQDEDLRGLGLVDRFLYSFPPPYEKMYLFDTAPENQTLRCAYHNLLASLLDDRDNAKYITLSPDARELFKGFCERNWNFQRPKAPRDFRGYLNKHCGVVGRIAGILQAATDKSTIVTSETMQNAIAIGDYFRQQAESLILGGAMFDSDMQFAETVYSVARDLADTNGEVKLRDIYRKLHRKKTDLVEPLQILVDTNRVAESDAPFEQLATIKLIG